MVNAGQRKVASIKSFLDSLAMRSTAYVTTRPRYGVLDVVGLLFRELLLMVVVFLLIFAIGAAVNAFVFVDHQHVLHRHNSLIERAGCAALPQ